MKTLIMNRNIIVPIFVVMLLIYGVQGVSYGQRLNYDLEGSPPTVTPGEINTTLKVSFPDIFYAYDENAYQVQLRRKIPQGEWTTACTVVSHGGRRGGGGNLSDLPLIGIFFFPGTGSSAEAGNVNFIFTNLEPGTTYEARYRDTNLSECPEDHENPPDADPWSTIVEGTTHLVTPPRVEFVDANLARAVRKALNLDTGGEHIELLKIPEAPLAKLTELNAESPKIVNLTGLEHASQLTKLLLEKNGISDITLLEQLINLTWLSLSSNEIRDINPLSGLTNLTELYLYENQISDITPLSGLMNLTKLSIFNNRITDITPLSGLTNLTELYLYENQISDINPLSGLMNLTKLSIFNNRITDITPLSGLTNLTELYLYDNQISDITPLAGFSGTTLDLSNNRIKDVTPLAKLISLEELLLKGNPIEDASPLNALLDENPDLDIDIAKSIIQVEGGTYNNGSSA